MWCLVLVYDQYWLFSSPAPSAPSASPIPALRVVPGPNKCHHVIPSPPKLPTGCPFPAPPTSIEDFSLRPPPAPSAPSASPTPAPRVVPGPNQCHHVIPHPKLPTGCPFQPPPTNIGDFGLRPHRHLRRDPFRPPEGLNPKSTILTMISSTRPFE